MADGSITINTDLDNKGFEKGLKGLKGIAGGVLGSITGATVAVGSALATITTQSVKARGEIEQSIGGVQTLFKENADAVIENANEAYKKAGVSADEYMKGVTSFSASLLQGLGGDTAKAAKIADMAFVDMSDNANKFGTDMVSIQTAYQGFAKQNYTINLMSA